MAPPKPAPLNLPAEKLSLATRKNIRDEWENKKGELEANLSKLLGEPWCMTADANLISTNFDAPDYAARIGTVIYWYMEAVVDNVKRYLSKNGDDGKAELNRICSAHTISFGPQDTTTFNYGGLDITKDGILRVVFARNHFASNVSDVSSKIVEALNTAAAASGTASAFNLTARTGVRDKYDPKIEDVQEKIAALTGVKDIKLNPRFEENSALLAKPPKKGQEGREDWDRILGDATLNYFEGVAYQLQSKKFEDDEMLQEGFQEAVTKNEIAMRVVEKLAGTGSSYNEIVIEDGIFWIQTTQQYFWTNVNDAAEKILDIL